MATATLGPFPGLAPRYARSRQGDTFADTAIDVDLSDGTLRPWYENLPTATTNTHNGYFCGCEFIDLTECETADTHMGRCEEIVISGNGSTTIGACGADRCDIRVPCPPSAPSVMGSSTDTARYSHQTQYAYTYKTVSGHETSLSYPSTPIQKNDYSTTVLSDFVIPPVTQCVEQICIYRLMTGYRSGTEEQREDLTGWVRIATIPVDTLSYADTVSDLDAGQANVTEGRHEAPADLTHVRVFADGDRLVGHTATTIRQSMPGDPHWWPVEFETSLGHRVTGLAVHQTFVAAFTPQGVYLVPPADAQAMTCTRPLFCSDAPTPLIFHDSRRWTTTKGSILYVSDEGIIELSGDGTWRNLTENWLSVDDWRRIAPETMRIGYDGRRLFFTSDVVSYILTLAGESSQLTQFSDYPERYLRSPTGELLLLQNNQVEQFDSGDLRREAKWSKIVNTKLSRYRWYQVDTQGLATLTVNGADTKLAGRCAKGSLSKYRKSTKQAINISTRYEVFKLNISSSQSELVNAPF